MRLSVLSYAVVCITSIHLVYSKSTDAKSRNATRTDPMKCKLTQLGIEYSGFAATTSSGIRCQPWFSEQPLHKVSENIKDADFPERSMRLAKNYCRNPTRDARGPWCYTMEPTLIDDACNVPLCHYGECRISGPGAEYGGTRKTSSSRRECKSWDKRQKSIDGQTDKFDDSRFSDLSRQKAKSFCRNPDGSTSGPWCYVERDDYETVEKEHCDIPFCDDKDCLVYVRNASTYSTVTALNATLGNITFWIKLWNPGDERKGEAKLLLSVLPIPASAERIAQDWRAGVEIVIGNSGSGQSRPNADGQRDFEETPDVLVGSKWNGFWIAWGGGFISVGRYGTSKPLFADEYKKRNSAVSLYPDGFLYYGLMGTGVLWSTEFCQDTCEVHTTHGVEFLRVWPLVRTNDTYDLRFYVRATRNAVIRLYQSPGAPFPSFTLTIGDADTVTVEYREGESTGSLHLGDVPRKGLLDFWSWREFTLSIFGEELRLYSRRTYGSEEDVRVNHRLIGTLRWFSVGSTETVAHWSFSCPPGESHAVEEPWTPNCITTNADYRYEGSQWTGADQVPCVPWISKEIPENEREDALFVDGSAVKALNKCRNPTKDPEGPFCYAITSQELPASKSYCPIRKCRSSDCRMSGTADDYVGTLSVTRSGRTCAKWLSDYDAEELARAKARSAKKKPGDASPRNTSTPKNPYPRPVHPVEPVYFNDTLYPERNVTSAVNYCRDPSRNIAGTWCYTTDPRVPRDLCNVRDCTKPEECTFFVKGHGLGRRLYILPEYRSEGLLFSLKEWEPSRPDSITFVFTADDGFKSRYILKIGAANNEKVLLYHQSETEGIKLVKKKTLPHLLYLGRWSSFRLRIPRGRVEVYYEGAPTPLFEWEHPELAKAFVPIYYYYASELGNTIGVAFDCNAKCHVENTETDRFTRILPLSMWRKEETPNPDGIVLMIRAKGVVLIPLLMLPSTPGSYGLSLGEAGHWILFLKNLYPNVRIYHKQKSPGPLFTNDTWTNITLRWYDRTLDVYRNETLVFHYEHREPLLFYFFSLAVDFGGWAIWAANCIPSDIDGDPEDGGWSEWGPWSCSVSCGGGMGTRKRICDSPEPNVRGEPCTGPDITSGRCNENVCGDVSSDTISLIAKRIRKNHTALTAREGRAVIVPCDHDVVTAIASESPDSEIQWSRNGIFLKETRGRVEIKDYDIVINRAILNDSGIYTIVLHRVDESRLIFKVVSLAVEPVESVSIVRETLPLVLTCHCVVLGYVYSNLKISWTIDDRPWKDYGTTLPIAVNVDRVPAINYSHRGTWRCVVEQNDLDFRWTSNVVTVKVIGAPNWRSHLMEDKFTKPIFGWMPNESFVAVAALVLFAMLTCCIVAGAVALIRFRDSLKFKGFGTTAGKESETASTKSKLRRGLEAIQSPSPNEREEQRSHGERLRGKSEMRKPTERKLQIRGKRKGGGKNERTKDAAESRKLIVDSETEE